MEHLRNPNQDSLESEYIDSIGINPSCNLLLLLFDFHSGGGFADCAKWYLYLFSTFV
jgi:hypothetical protein